ncbi:MAG: TetR/AcrR family transcriptional regulator, partial [Myxococcota bacterium]
MSNTKNRNNRSEETRSRIVQAAVQMFASHGFDGASTRQIARLAGANQGLVTYYFSSKENLWKEAVESIFGEMQAKLLPHLLEYQHKDLDTRARLKIMIHALVRYAAHQPEQMRLMIQEGKTDSDRMTWLVDTHVKPMYQLLSAAIQPGQAEGILPPGAPVHYFYIVV